MELKLNRDEVLRYSGVRGSFDALPLQMQQKYEAIIRFTEQNAHYNYTWRVFPICADQPDQPVLVQGSCLRLSGVDIRRHLRHCSRCILFALSLGVWADRQLTQFQAQNMADGVIFDACATELIEVASDTVCGTLQEQYGALTPRFGPGYGDLSIAIQPDFIRTIGADKKLGLTVKNGMMAPMKSITAVIGIYDTESRQTDFTSHCRNKCADCKNRCKFYRP